MNSNITTLSPTSRTLPDWHPPLNNQSELKLYNSLTKQKDIFVPNSTNLVKWYNCGPTVYDASHMGHARLYVTIDYLRRIMEEYFGYNTLFVMNITDIDDKIIVRARQNHLFENYKKEKIKEEELTEAIAEYKKKYLSDIQESEIMENNSNNIKLTNYKNAIEALKLCKGELSENDKTEVFQKSKEVLIEWLDALKGETIKDHEIFNKLAIYWEDEFFKDMKALNVKECDVVTRVSEYVREIVQFVETIVNNGYAYETNGSVYFDTMKFNNSENHYYAKLKPNQINNLSLIEEGEGQLTNKGDQKKCIADFALWKKSKAGEPYWQSPWGEGRPGWHIECSAMAGHVLGKIIDIHSGGIDLTFPHHDNELAQSEACYNSKQWINYFLHVGHLHINGLKMSKSLKNFITIKEALLEYTSSQLRICFLMHSWYSPMDFKSDIMDEASSIERNIKNYIANSQATIMKLRDTPKNTHEYNEKEKLFMDHIKTKQHAIHEALLDSLNTPIVIRELNSIISETNKYLDSGTNPFVITYSINYVTRMLNILGLNLGQQNVSGSAAAENSGVEYLKILSRFRDEVRRLAISSSSNNNKDILVLCDRIRDVELRELGVVLDDKEDGKAIIKILNKEDLKLQDKQTEKIRVEKERKLNELKLINEKKQKEKTEQSKIAPLEMFKNNPAYSRFDQKGIPTHDNDGAELTKSKIKKLTKEWEKQNKLHMEYLNK